MYVSLAPPSGIFSIPSYFTVARLSILFSSVHLPQVALAILAPHRNPSEAKLLCTTVDQGTWATMLTEMIKLTFCHLGPSTKMMMLPPLLLTLLVILRIEIFSLGMNKGIF